MSSDGREPGLSESQLRALKREHWRRQHERRKEKRARKARLRGTLVHVSCQAGISQDGKPWKSRGVTYRFRKGENRKRVEPKAPKESKRKRKLAPGFLSRQARKSSYDNARQACMEKQVKRGVRA